MQAYLKVFGSLSCTSPAEKKNIYYYCLERTNIIILTQFRQRAECKQKSVSWEDERFTYIGCVYGGSRCHANILIWDQLEVQVLQDDCESNNRFQQCKLIPDALPRSSTEWDKSGTKYFQNHHHHHPSTSLWAIKPKIESAPR